MKGASRLSASHPGVTWGHSGLVSDLCLNNLRGKGWLKWPVVATHRAEVKRLKVFLKGLSPREPPVGTMGPQ